MADNSRNRRSTRLPGFDYSQSGAYFVTVCSHKWRQLFGRVQAGRVHLTPLGILVVRSLKSIPGYYLHVELDEHIVMPNHLHVILLFGTGTINRARTEKFGKPVAGSLSTVVRNFKAGVTRDWRRVIGNGGANIWQSGFYDRVIRNNRELNAIRRYIRQNPLKWELDRYHR